MRREKLYIWAKLATPAELAELCDRAEIKMHYFQRLYRGTLPDPRLDIVRRIIAAMDSIRIERSHGRVQGQGELPYITLNDI